MPNRSERGGGGGSPQPSQQPAIGGTNPKLHTKKTKKTRLPPGPRGVGHRHCSVLAGKRVCDPCLTPPRPPCPPHEPCHSIMINNSTCSRSVSSLPPPSLSLLMLVFMFNVHVEVGVGVHLERLFHALGQAIHDLRVPPFSITRHDRQRERGKEEKQEEKRFTPSSGNGRLARAGGTTRGNHQGKPPTHATQNETTKNKSPHSISEARNRTKIRNTLTDKRGAQL